jgi:hypothetical protein
MGTCCGLKKNQMWVLRREPPLTIDPMRQVKSLGHSHFVFQQIADKIWSPNSAPQQVVLPVIVVMAGHKLSSILVLQDPSKPKAPMELVPVSFQELDRWGHFSEAPCCGNAESLKL